MISQLANSSGLSYSIHANYHDDVRLLSFRNAEFFRIHRIIFSQEGCNLIAENGIQFLGIDIFVSRNTFFDTLDDVQSCFNTYVGSDEHFFQVVQNFIIYL